MKKLAIVATSVATSFFALASTGLFTNAYAQEKTRAQVRQELIEAEQNGLQYVTDASYPDVSPIFAQQVARMKAAHAASGMAEDANHTATDAAAGTTDSGKGMDPQGSTMSGMRAGAMNTGAPACVGPQSFCNIFSGS
ncbi:DUF4148 domain-containing protein [Paraburkholderia phosphatilytica]|uniref:DUF4148 domain-containing protein n=1 Tax=Paraburkholderia phosphatilytica TaxID=2282883 RepID=UPI000E50ECF3|nr:DUF4148 domain-containing protein [Paraburkholderia phosphatilytica]